MDVKKLCWFAVFGLLMSSVSWAQLFDSERSQLRKGNKAYQSGDLESSQQAYENALNENAYSPTGHFNLGNALYAKKDTNAARHFEQAATYSDSDEERARAYHNLGNAFMKQGKLQEGVEAYKRSLRLNPKDEDTRYNLAYALEMLRQQQQQQQNQDNQDGENDENQDQNQDQDKQQDQDQNQENQDQDQENQDQQNQDQDNQDQQDQQQQDTKREGQPQQMSKEEIEQMLEALRYQEEKLQEKLQKQKGKAKKIKGEKDW